MAGEQESFRRNEELADQTPSHVARQIAPSVSIAELGEAEAVFRAAESNTLVEPTLERWTQFNEHVMDHVVKSLQRRPTFRERRQAFLDRLLASDSRLKEKARLIVTVVLLVFVTVVAYLLF